MLTACFRRRRREAAKMNRPPGSEKKSHTARRPQEANTHASDPKLVEFVRALARAAAREDHRKVAEATLRPTKADEQ
jgi:hypothetical protein